MLPGDIPPKRNRVALTLYKRKDLMYFTITIKSNQVDVGNDRLKLTQIFTNLNEALDYIKLCYSKGDVQNEV